MTNWVWLNIPLCVIVFLAVVGIPLRLVLTDPGQRAAKAEASRSAGNGDRHYKSAA
jgi:hypothetical protein